MNNQKKHLENIEKDYVATLKQFRRLEKNPSLEQQLMSRNQDLQEAIEHEKQTQIEQVQSHKQMDRKTNKLIVTQTGFSTEKPCTDKSISLG